MDDLLEYILVGLIPRLRRLAPAMVGVAADTLRRLSIIGGMRQSPV
jgi:hypothetical protein